MVEPHQRLEDQCAGTPKRARKQADRCCGLAPHSHAELGQSRRRGTACACRKSRARSSMRLARFGVAAWHRGGRAAGAQQVVREHPDHAFFLFEPIGSGPAAPMQGGANARAVPACIPDVDADAW